MEGLEISEVKLSELKNDVETFRLDSEYQSKEYILINDFIKKNQHRFCKFDDLGIEIDCSAFYPGIEQFYETGSIPLIRVQNVKGTIEYENCVKIPRLNSLEYSTLKMVEEGDIVITKGGSIGFVGYVTKPAYVSRDLIFIKSSKLSEEERIFLYFYLSSEFSYKQLIRSSSQCAQPHLTITLVKNFDLLKANKRVTSECLKLYKNAHSLLEQSKKDYKDAENLLLESLGVEASSLRSDAGSIASHNIKTLFQSFGSTGRLDAEYYQEKYDRIEEMIANIGNVDFEQYAILNDTNFTPQKNETYKYIELANIGTTGEITGFTESFGEELPTRARRLVHKGDILISSIEGSLQSCAIVTNEYDNALCSTGFYVLSPTKEYNVETLLLLYKSEPIQALLKKGCSGTILTAISKEAFTNIKFPKVSATTQQQIAALVQQSFVQKAESKALLQQAKAMVEAEIEK